MYFELYKSATNNQWYWRLKSANHQTVATGGEGYVNKADAVNGINLVKSTTTGTPVREI
jgi:uncharacterized protein YegP (UPF0339 family)